MYSIEEGFFQNIVPDYDEEFIAFIPLLYYHTYVYSI